MPPVRRTPQESTLEIRLPALNTSITNIKDWSITSNFTVPTDEWHATIYDSRRERMRALALQPVELLVNGVPQLIGRVDVREVTGSDGLATIISGRDFIADLTECSVDPTAVIKEGVTILDAFAQVAGPCGIDAIIDDGDVAMRDVRTGVPVTKNKHARHKKGLKLPEYKPKPGESVFEYLNRVAARQGCTIQPGPDRRTLVVIPPNYKQAPTFTLVRNDTDPSVAQHNNVLRSSVREDYSKFPTHILANGWQASTQGKTAVNADREYDTHDLAVSQARQDIVEILTRGAVKGRRKPNAGALPDLQGKLYRLMYYRDAEARTQEQLEFGLRRAVGDRLKDTLVYKATVQGHVYRPTGALWAVDTMVSVADDICGVFEDLWVMERTFNYAPGAGATTDLVCIRPGAFQVDDPG